MLEREGAFYKAHQDEFRKKYLDKWLVIAGESLWGAYDTLHEAAQNALDQLKPGQFIIHRPADDGKIIKIGPFLQNADAGRKQRAESAISAASGGLTVIPYA